MRDESLHARTQLTSCVVKINENPVFNEILCVCKTHNGLVYRIIFF